MRNGNYLPAGWKRPSLFGDFFGDFNHFFEDLPAARQETSLNWNRFGACDVEEVENAYRIHLDMPGLSKEDIKIDVLGNRLSVKAEKVEKKESTDREKNYHLKERSVGSFERSFALGDAADFNGIQARYENGVLSLEIPKRETAKQKTIVVK